MNSPTESYDDCAVYAASETNLYSLQRYVCNGFRFSGVLRPKTRLAATLVGLVAYACGEALKGAFLQHSLSAVLPLSPASCSRRVDNGRERQGVYKEQHTRREVNKRNKA